MTEHKLKLDELIPQLKSCGYECEAGKLECNIAFRQIAHIIERIDYIFKRQREGFNPEEFTRHDLEIKQALETQMDFIITGCSLKRFTTDELVAELKTRHALCPVVDDMNEPVCMFVTTRKSLVTELCKRDGVESSDIECADGIAKTIVIHGWKE